MGAAARAAPFLHGSFTVRGASFPVVEKEGPC